MSGGGPSSTAIGAALMRAVHTAFDEEPKVLRDPLARSFAGIADDTVLRGAAAKLVGEFTQRAGDELGPAIVRYLRASIVLRNRYAEDGLSEAMARGLHQYVLLGARLDSFAWREPQAAARLRVLEVDLPAMQDWKRQRLAALDLATPPTLRFVPIDFEREALLATLEAAGFDRRAPAFFSWLGVTGYLTEAAIFETLGAVAHCAAGSEIVFGYGLKDTLLDARGQQVQAVLKAGIAARNEPAANAGFVPAELAQSVRAAGFATVEDFGADAANARYFAGRGDGLRISSMTHLMRARIG